MNEHRVFLKAMLDRQEYGKREQNEYLDVDVFPPPPPEKQRTRLSSIPSFTCIHK